jgi:hypothetical protein
LYFERNAMKRRHRQALAEHDPLNANTRLRALGIATMRALVDALEANQARQREAAAAEKDWTSSDPEQAIVPELRLD